MGRGERDPVDPSLIIAQPRVPRPTARAQGLDNRERTKLNTPNAPKKPEKAKG